jgi:hypothetical protein
VLKNDPPLIALADTVTITLRSATANELSNWGRIRLTNQYDLREIHRVAMSAYNGIAQEMVA